MKFLYRLLFVIVFLSAFAFVVAYARGYRIDIGQKSLVPTGIMSVTSYPKAAKIYVDGTLKGVTDTNLTMAPGNYKVEIQKDGYTSFSKNVNLKGELVATIDALLFPLNPTLAPLTNLGIIKALSLGDTEKVIIFSDTGIYLFEGGRKPLPFFPPLKTIILKENLPVEIDLATSRVTVSPDAKEAIFEFGEENVTQAYLLSLEGENLTPFDVTQSKETLIEAWEVQKLANNLKVLETFPTNFYKLASDSSTILSFSPTETKVLYKANKTVTLPPMITPPIIAANQTEETRNIKEGGIYIYDKKEDKNYQIADPSAAEELINQSIQWYFDSRHLLINEGKKIIVVDYDNSNKKTVYSGPYESGFFTTTLDGRIITLSNLNPEVNERPDLYLVGTR